MTLPCRLRRDRRADDELAVQIDHPAADEDALAGPRLHRDRDRPLPRIDLRRKRRLVPLRHRQHAEHQIVRHPAPPENRRPPQSSPASRSPDSKRDRPYSPPRAAKPHRRARWPSQSARRPHPPPAPRCPPSARTAGATAQESPSVFAFGDATIRGGGGSGPTQCPGSSERFRHRMRNDIETRADIDALMVLFYGRAMRDPLIGPPLHRRRQTRPRPPPARHRRFLGEHALRQRRVQQAPPQPAARPRRPRPEGPPGAASLPALARALHRQRRRVVRRHPRRLRQATRSRHRPPHAGVPRQRTVDAVT